MWIDFVLHHADKMIEFNLCLVCFGIKHAINISYREHKFNKLLIQHKKVNLLDLFVKKNIFVSSIRYFWRVPVPVHPGMLVKYSYGQLGIILRVMEMLN